MHNAVNRRVIDARFGRYQDISKFDLLSSFGNSVHVPKTSYIFQCIKKAFSDQQFIRMHCWYTKEQLFEELSNFISKKLFSFNHLCYIISIASVDNDFIVTGAGDNDTCVYYPITTRTTFTSTYKMFIVDKGVDN